MAEVVKRPKAQKTSVADDYQTPAHALDPLMPYVVEAMRGENPPRSLALNDPWTVWECAAGKGNLVDGLEWHGFNVIATDILTGQDFLMWEPEEHWDCIITNPPYSLKQEFLERCYLLGKPFALLLPLTTFETQRRQTLFKDYGLEVVFLPKRINFEVASGEGSGAWFAVAWFTWGFNIGKELSF